MPSSDCSPLAPWCSSHSSPSDRPNQLRKAVRDDETAGAATGRPAMYETGALVALSNHDGSLSRAKAILHRLPAARCQVHPVGLRQDAQAKRALARAGMTGRLERVVPGRPFSGTQFLLLAPNLQDVKRVLPTCLLREKAEVLSGGAADESSGARLVAEDGGHARASRGRRCARSLRRDPSADNVTFPPAVGAVHAPASYSWEMSLPV